MNETELAEFLKWFQVPDRDVYVLGCFARHVTLFSQQVRAINLISVLLRAGRIKKGSRIAVIGGGAAGLTAAAAASFSGCMVTLLDKLDGPMELQRNNRQRWIHPFIYDWPATANMAPEANLPLLTWRAGYAWDVAEQICSQWLTLTSKSKSQIPTIEDFWGCSYIFVGREHGHLQVNWTDRNTRFRTEPFDCVIMAVGFGLEPEEIDSGRDSYWIEDRVDGDFRNPTNPPQWLISGVGDGALTDVMRLCIRRFRHHEVVEIFSDADGIESLKRSLRDIHSGESPLDEEIVDRKFRELLGGEANNPSSLRFSEFRKKLEEKNRLRNGKQVILVSKHRFLYGPKSSILNRLIVYHLEQLKRIRFIPHKLESVQKIGSKYQVKLHSQRDTIVVDHLIRREGIPDDSHPLQDFAEIWEESKSLREDWRRIDAHRDRSRTPLWIKGEFGQEGREEVDSDRIGEQAFSVRARRLSVNKQLRDDGSSLMLFKIEGLEVKTGTLKGLQMAIKGSLGMIGLLVLDEDAIKMRIALHPQKSTAPALTAQQTRVWTSQLSQTLYFPDMGPKDPAISFGFTIPVVNGDALSAWEYEQMYGQSAGNYANGDPLPNAEFLMRFVWFPIDELVIRITLPTRIESKPFLRVFRCPQRQIKGDLVKAGILQMAPPSDSRSHPSKCVWSEAADIAARDSKYLRNLSWQTWELAVPNPEMGACYSLNWNLPVKTPRTPVDIWIGEVEAVREELLRHGNARRNGSEISGEIHANFRSLAKSLREAHGNPKVNDESESVPETGPDTKDEEQFEVSMMTYNSATGDLVMVEAFLSDTDQMESKLGKAQLPFGQGLAGAAFREASKIFMYLRPKADDDTEMRRYLRLEDSIDHEILVSMPLHHPGVSQLPENSPLRHTFEPSRTCIGVVNVGSNKANSRLSQNLDETGRRNLRSVCQTFANQLFVEFHQ